MTSRKRRLDSTLAALQQQYGPRALRPASELASPKPDGLATGFPQLDQLTGCHGVPQGSLTLLSGETNSGKLVIAYKILAGLHTRARRGQAALIDLKNMSDPDLLTRCGVDLNRLVVWLPHSGKQAVDLWLDAIRSNQFRMIVVDSLPDLSSDPAALKHLQRSLPALNAWLTQTQCAVIVLDELRPVWLRWAAIFDRSPIRHSAALQLEFRHEHWLEQNGQVCGWRTRARLVASRWARSGGQAALDILFNGTVRAAATW